MKEKDQEDRYEFKRYSIDSVPLRVTDVFTVHVLIKDGENVVETEDEFFVVENGSQTFLGRDTANKLGLLRIGLPSMINNVEVQEGKKFPKIKGVKLKIPINESVNPVQQHARRPPIALLKRIENKLDALQSMDIIEQV